MKQVTMIIRNEEGLHARPANLLAKAAMKFTSDIKLHKNGDMSKVFNPKSILSILSMGASKGDEITVIVNGDDEAEAISKITDMINNGFNE